MRENKYDDRIFFKKYSQMARSQKGLSGAGEWHELEKLLPDFRSKRVLDLGCGYGWHCKYAADHGAVYVLGIDISKRMLDTARTQNFGSRIEYQQAAMEELCFPDNSFDVVFSSLAFHYVRDFAPLVEHISRWLAPGGSFVFSVEHPVFTAYGSQDWYYNADGEILHFPVDNYYIEGRREAVFLGERVTKYHRTLTTYLGTLLQNGFQITGVVEPTPPEDMMDIPGMKDELRRPIMLLVSARRNNMLKETDLCPASTAVPLQAGLNPPVPRYNVAKIRVIFLDLDDTILDFSRAEASALRRVLTEEGIPAGDAVLARYHDINAAQWVLLEEGEITRPQVLTRRFSILFDELGVTGDPKAVCERYEKYLAGEVWFVPGAEALLKALAPRYDLYIASNGTAAVQHRRLAAAGIGKYVQKVFISQEIGADKPNPAFFDACFSVIPGLSRQEALMVGDSLTSDIRGGRNAGMATCWFNPQKKPWRKDIRPDFEIHSLEELPPLLAGERPDLI